MSVAGSDPQSVVLLSAPQNWQISLVRLTDLAAISTINLTSPAIRHKLQLDEGEVGGNVTGEGIVNLVDTVGMARAWRTDTADARAGFAIRAEVDIPRGATPTFEFPYCTVNVGSLSFFSVSCATKLRLLTSLGLFFSLF